MATCFTWSSVTTCDNGREDGGHSIELGEANKRCTLEGMRLYPTDVLLKAAIRNELAFSPRNWTEERRKAVSAWSCCCLATDRKGRSSLPRVLGRRSIVGVTDTCPGMASYKK